MHYCQMELQGPVAEPCGKPASVKIGGCWLCEFHADALERFEARTSQPEWIARQTTSQPDDQVEE
jgi:hypothetical protein